MSYLKPCPFCDSEPTVSTYETESLWSKDQVTYTKVECPECEIAFHSEPGYELEAPAAWNRRSIDLTSEGEAVDDIGDSVLAWMVKYDLLDAGNEYQSSDVIAVLDDLAPSELTAPQPAQPDLEVVAWRWFRGGFPNLTGSPTMVRHAEAQGSPIEPLVRLTDAQAHIAALTAKVGNQKAAGYCDAQYLSDGPPFKCGWQHRAETAEARVAQLEEALSPSGETKAAYMGEFHMGVTLYLDGEEETRRVQIPWTSIKEIMAAIRGRAALKENSND